MRHLRVVGWERLQHYKDRSPPWIKLYYDDLDDYGFGCLQDASKWLAIGIRLLASRCGNHIPADPEWIAGKLSCTDPVDLQVLLDAGVVVYCDCCEHDASKTLAQRQRQRRDREEKNQDTGGTGGLAPPCDPPSEEAAWTTTSSPTRRSGGSSSGSPATRSSMPSGGASTTPSIGQGPSSPNSTGSIPPSSRTGDVASLSEPSPEFASFWSAYPRKVSRAAAEKAFLRVPKRPPVAELIRAIQDQHLAQRDPQYIPHASTWLNQRRWEDEPEPVARRNGNGSAPLPKAAVYCTTEEAEAMRREMQERIAAGAVH